MPILDPEAIITRLYPLGSRLRALLLRHGELVGGKALGILDQSPWLAADRQFVIQAAMLHDIGVGQTRCPALGCKGRHDYVCHGVEGRKILDQLGFPRFGLVCERHVGVGLTAAQIRRRRLPLPVRDMVPISVEERLVCYADKFFSKTDNPGQEKAIDTIVDSLVRFDPADADRFMQLHRQFTRPPAGRDRGPRDATNPCGDPTDDPR